MAIEDLNQLGNESFIDYSEVSTDMSENYKHTDNKLSGELPRGVGGDSEMVRAKKSLFNNFYVFSGDSSNVYLDEDLQTVNKFKNPTVQNLVANKQGANRYDYSDFAYAKKFGEIPNNRLVTLRRFKYPVYDDIFTGRHEPDIARLITWSDQEDNKLSELFNMSFGMNWRQLTAAMEEMQMEGNTIGYDGVIGKILNNYVSPNTNPQQYYNPTHDHNKTHGPVDSIHQTNIRDIGLKFDQTIKLTFRYELRSIDGINPKTAFVDLLSHILACTMNDGKFWGGARYWAGRPPSEYAARIRHWSVDKFAEFTQASNVNVKGIMSTLAQSVSNISAGQVVNMATQILKNMAMSKVLDVVGRASVPMMNSLLTNEPTGEWHLTVGNPFRPMFVAGNLILKNTTITVDDATLGYDDFPTSLIVTCELDHGMPRDRSMIEQMFNVGNGRTYWKPDKNSFNKITKSGKFVKESMQGHSAGNIAVVSRELYSFAKTQLYGYSDSAQPKSAGSGQLQNSNAAPNNTQITGKK